MIIYRGLYGPYSFIRIIGLISMDYCIECDRKPCIHKRYWHKLNSIYREELKNAKRNET